jgi:hypothetical protein
MKSDQWPTKSQESVGVRLINPAEEWDYGPHIVEDEKTNHLVGLTPAGRYQIEVCDLNADHFILERKTRTELHKAIDADLYRLRNRTSDLDLLQENLDRLQEILRTMIPVLPKLIP